MGEASKRYRHDTSPRGGARHVYSSKARHVGRRRATAWHTDGRGLVPGNQPTEPFTWG